MPFLNTDIPELSGFDTGLCLSNLDVLGQRQHRVSESVLAILSELADSLICDAGDDPDTVDSILLSLQSTPDMEEESLSDLSNLPDAARTLAAISPVNRETILRMSAHSGLYARLVLYRMIEERMPSYSTAEGDRLPPPLPATIRGRVAYMPGAFADKAYLRLTAPLKNPRAATTTSFVDACEEVHNGLCEYCILPLENTHSGRLPAFTRLILRYRLQVVAVCDLENSAADGQITRFALLREAKEGRFPSLLSTEDEPLASPCLELIHLTDSPSFTDLLVAAEFCGLSLSRADTLPPFDELELFSEEDSPAVAFSCVLNAEEGDLGTFRRFLSLEAPEDILVGLYGNV